jgi:hypothetical protein
MISISTKEPIPWLSPLSQPGKPRTFYLRAGSIRERAFLEAELAGDCRAGEVYDFQLGAAFAAGVRHLLPDDPDGAEQLIQLEETRRSGEALPPEELQQLSQAEGVLAEHWPAYQELRGRAARRAQLLPLVSFRRFCTGWEGEDLPPFAAGMDGMVSEAAMEGLGSLEIRTAGAMAYMLLYGGAVAKDGGEAAEPKKSYGPRSRSAKGRKNSSSRASNEAGSSATTSGSKTPS